MERENTQGQKSVWSSFLFIVTSQFSMLLLRKIGWVGGYWLRSGRNEYKTIMLGHAMRQHEGLKSFTFGSVFLHWQIKKLVAFTQGFAPSSSPLTDPHLCFDDFGMELSLYFPANPWLNGKFDISRSKRSGRDVCQSRSIHVTLGARRASGFLALGARVKEKRWLLKG